MSFMPLTAEEANHHIRVFLSNGLQCKTVSIFTLSDRFVDVCKAVFSQHKGWEIGNAWEVPLDVEVRDLPILTLASPHSPQVEISERELSHQNPSPAMFHE